MAEFIVWPYRVLTPRNPAADVAAFTRSGGMSLGGVEPATRTDKGFWKVDYAAIMLRNRDKAQWKCWGAVRQYLSGRSGLIAVRIPSKLSAPYVSGRYEPEREVAHDDMTLFSDGTGYSQGAISIVTDGITPLGATTIKLRIIKADADLVGTRFSYNHAAYETGPAISITGDVWEVSVSPAIRQLIPAGSDLDFETPTCLCHLASDGEMDISEDWAGKNSAASVGFVEATDYWSRLALGLS